jgi:hypothetical protein
VTRHAWRSPDDGHKGSGFARAVRFSPKGQLLACPSARWLAAKASGSSPAFNAVAIILTLRMYAGGSAPPFPIEGLLRTRWSGRTATISPLWRRRCYATTRLRGDEVCDMLAAA